MPKQPDEVRQENRELLNLLAEKMRDPVFRQIVEAQLHDVEQATVGMQYPPSTPQRPAQSLRHVGGIFR